MKKTIALVVFIVCFAMLSGIAFAESLCSDTDDGNDDYDRKGKVKYGITEEEDRCVLGPQADVRAETSLYLKEYYCSQDARKSQIIECSREGFERCYQGACIGGKAGGSTTGNTTTTSIPELPICGDKKVNQYKEQCDPPGKICYTESFEIGICDSACQCDVKLKATGELINETEENKTTTQPTANVTVPAAEPKEEIPAETPKEEPKEEVKAEPVVVPEQTTAPEEEKPKGFFSVIWAWIKGLFS